MPALLPIPRTRHSRIGHTPRASPFPPEPHSQCTSGGCGVEHRTPEYLNVRRDAWGVLWVYAIGVPCAYAFLLFHERHIIMDERKAPLADALDFLHSGYRPTCYFWEIINLMHKQFAVGFATIILPGTVRRVEAASSLDDSRSAATA